MALIEMNFGGASGGSITPTERLSKLNDDTESTGYTPDKNVTAIIIIQGYKTQFDLKENGTTVYTRTTDSNTESYKAYWDMYELKAGKTYTIKTTYKWQSSADRSMYLITLDN